MKIHHVGIVCNNIEKAIYYYKKQFNVKEQTSIIYDELQKANLCLLKTDTGLDVEFIAGEQVSHLGKGITYYHLCYTVKNINDVIEEFQDKGAVLVSTAKPAVLFEGRLVAFLLIKSGLIELLEEKND